MERGALEALLKKMEQDWDQRALENARYYIATGLTDYSDEAFFASGERTVEEHILTDMTNICQGRDPRQMRVLEIGCGAGRITKALAKVFGEVHAVDVSGEMIRQARQLLKDVPNVYLYKNNGMDLSVLPRLRFDFAFSFIVFQHISSIEVIESYIREVWQLLRPGALFKFQVQGCPDVEVKEGDTWVGVPITAQLAYELAGRNGFELRYMHGEGTQYFWLWYFKRRWPYKFWWACQRQLGNLFTRGPRIFRSRA